ncbi:hypothetical protein IscW_ISCW010813, partial [Ixodes scapularis]
WAKKLQQVRAKTDGGREVVFSFYWSFVFFCAVLTHSIWPSTNSPNFPPCCNIQAETGRERGHVAKWSRLIGSAIACKLPAHCRLSGARRGAVGTKGKSNEIAATAAAEEGRAHRRTRGKKRRRPRNIS